eukprot:c34617_g1_i1 orf=160-366(-)
MCSLLHKLMHTKNYKLTLKLGYAKRLSESQCTYSFLSINMSSHALVLHTSPSGERARMFFQDASHLVA